MRKRNYGLDIARIAAMCGVVVLHILGRGGVLTELKPLQASYVTSWWLEILAYGSVNVFAMLSGILGADSKKKSSYRALELLSIVLLYSVVITVLFYIFSPDLIGGKKGLIFALFPILTKTYWYITDYIPLALLQPYINKWLKFLTNEQLQKLCFVFIAVISVVPSVTRRDLFAVNAGYSFVWLVMCYFFGAYIKRVDFFAKIKHVKIISVVVFFACSLVLLGGNVLEYKLIEQWGYMIAYDSPFILLMAVCVIVFMNSEKEISSGKALVVLSSTAFDTYLLHAHPLVFDNLFKRGFTWIAGLPTAAIPFTVIGCAALIYLAAFVVARIRIFLYDKLKVKKLLQLIAKPIDKLIYPASMD